jgi:probable HAF family extracellular repeat protein
MQFNNSTSTKNDTNMKSKFRILLAAITFFAGLALLFVALALPLRLAAQERQQQQPERPQHYTVTDLGTLGGSASQACGVSNRGSASGFSELSGDNVVHAFFWQSRTITDLGTLGGPNSFAPEEAPPNDRDEVAGFSDTATLDPNGEQFCALFGDFGPYICRPFVWRDGVMTELPTLGGNNAAAVAINNRSQLTGVAETAIADPTCFPPQLFDFKAAIWEPNGDIQELPPLPGDNESLAQAINDRGQAVGVSGTCANGPIEAVLWQNGTPINLGTLGGAVFNIAFGINNRDQVVGQSDLPGDTTHHAFLWQRGVMTDLGTILGLPVSLATGINNPGQVVGFSQDMNGNNTVAFLWQDGVMTDLNTLLPPDSPWFFIEALGINDRGQIAGYGLNTSTGEVHAIVATPTNRNTPSEGAPTTQGATGERPKVVLPENVRKFLQQRPGHWYRVRGPAFGPKD